MGIRKGDGGWFGVGGESPSGVMGMAFGAPPGVLVTRCTMKLSFSGSVT